MFKNRKISIFTAKKSSSLLWGNYRSTFVWSWMEFDDLRKYEIWDDIKSIDWLTTAKNDRVFIKKYIEERELPWLFIFSFSESMKFWSWKLRKSDTMLEAFEILWSSLWSNWDPFWFIAYSDTILEHIPYRKWVVNYLYAIKHIKQENRFTWKSQIWNVIDKLFNLKLKNNIVFIFTDELSIPDMNKFSALCKKNDLIYIHISDSFENDLWGSWIANLVSKKTFLWIDLDNFKLKSTYINKRKTQVNTFKKSIVWASWSFISLDDTCNVYYKLFDFFNLRKKVK